MSSDETVLIVEDQEGLAEAYSTVIASEYTVRTATSGEQALTKMDESVDVVILDRRMPGMSGDEVLEKLAERGETPSIAMVTAVEPDVDIIEMPLNEYVTKPIDNKELLDLVAVLLERDAHTDQMGRYFQLAAKQRALETADREKTTEYSDLTTELEELRNQLGSQIDDLPSKLDPSTSNF